MSVMFKYMRASMTMATIRAEERTEACRGFVGFISMVVMMRFRPLEILFV